MRTAEGSLFGRSEMSIAKLASYAAPKRPGVGTGGEALRPEESQRWARVPLSQLLSTPGRPWPVRDEFGSAGSRPSNFVESDVMIVDSKRSHGPNIRGE